MGECIPDAFDPQAARAQPTSNMIEGAPRLVALDHDDYSAKYVGRTADGRQFFLTSPFVPAEEVGTPTGREFLALYVFDAKGALLSAVIEDLGPRSLVDQAAAAKRHDELLASLGETTFNQIAIAPFRIERFGVEFGFIPQPPEEPGDDWSVIVEPGNYMSFSPPWDSGEYDT